MLPIVRWRHEISKNLWFKKGQKKNREWNCHAFDFPVSCVILSSARAIGLGFACYVWCQTKLNVASPISSLCKLPLPKQKPKKKKFSSVYLSIFSMIDFHWLLILCPYSIFLLIRQSVGIWLFFDLFYRLSNKSKSVPQQCHLTECGKGGIPFLGKVNLITSEWAWRYKAGC